MLWLKWGCGQKTSHVVFEIFYLLLSLSLLIFYLILTAVALSPNLINECHYYVINCWQIMSLRWLNKLI